VSDQPDFKVGDKVYVSTIQDIVDHANAIKRGTPFHGSKQIWTISKLDYRNDQVEVYTRQVRSRFVLLARLTLVPAVDALADTIRFHATEEDIGRGVVYTPYEGAQAEDGVITSMNEHYVFVRYGADKSSKATDPRDLQWLCS